MGAATAAAMNDAEAGTIDEDREGERIEEIAGDEFEELPIEMERETTALTGDEVAEDLMEVDAPAEALAANDYASDVVGDDPQAGIEAGIETHPETLELPPIQLEQESAESVEL